MPESVRREFQIPADHPCLDGHFPDQPIVPGVVLLDLVRQTASEWRPKTRISAFSMAKFHCPLYPEQSFTVSLTATDAFSVRFVCCRNHEKLASGSFTLENTD